MKRYTEFIKRRAHQPTRAEMVENADGAWVRYEDHMEHLREEWRRLGITEARVEKAERERDEAVKIFRRFDLTARDARTAEIKLYLARLDAKSAEGEA